jgi:glycyl-tRNA synthetase
MPFAAAQIGLGFRNEIAPRNGLLRVREFTMAEIEHFVHPEQKQHPKFASVAAKELVLFPADAQLDTGRTVRMTAGAAVAQGLINNETLGYFMARTQLFLEQIGVDPQRMRFRQHLKTEMSHYAADCWDMEIHNSYGWIECVGHADRSCYDLTQHSQRTGVPLVASERLAQPIQVTRLVAEANKKLLGPAFKTQQKAVLAAIEALSEEETVALQTQFLNSESKARVGEYELSAEMISFKQESKTVVEQKFTPSVIEPSFGIGRILYAVLEHAFSQRSADEQRCVMAFRPCVAPIKVGLFRLINHTPFDVVIDELKESLQSANLALRVDSSSGSVGRRYARADELGVPFGVTVDFQTLVDSTVTLRERDSMSQVRLPIAQLLPTLQALVQEKLTWQTVSKRFMLVKISENDDEGEGSASSPSAIGAPADAAVNADATVLEVTPRAAFSRPAIAVPSSI